MIVVVRGKVINQELELSARRRDGEHIWLTGCNRKITTTTILGVLICEIFFIPFWMPY